MAIPIKIKYSITGHFNILMLFNKTFAASNYCKIYIFMNEFHEIRHVVDYKVMMNNV